MNNIFCGTPLNSTQTVHNEEKVAHTGVTAPNCSYCLHAPETAKKNTITQGMRTSAHIFKSTGPIRGLRAAPMKTSYMKLPDIRICSPRATVQKYVPKDTAKPQIMATDMM